MKNLLGVLLLTAFVMVQAQKRKSQLSAVASNSEIESEIGSENDMERKAFREE